MDQSTLEALLITAGLIDVYFLIMELARGWKSWSTRSNPKVVAQTPKPVLPLEVDVIHHYMNLTLDVNTPGERLDGMWSLQLRVEAKNTRRNLQPRRFTNGASLSGEVRAWLVSEVGLVVTIPEIRDELVAGLMLGFENKYYYLLQALAPQKEKIKP